MFAQDISNFLKEPIEIDFFNFERGWTDLESFELIKRNIDWLGGHSQRIASLEIEVNAIAADYMKKLREHLAIVYPFVVKNLPNPIGHLCFCTRLWWVNLFLFSAMGHPKKFY